MPANADVELYVVNPTSNAQAPSMAEEEKEGLTDKEFHRFLEETRIQPGWRQEADLLADYYDGNQLTAAEVMEMEDSGRAPVITNLVKPVVDVVLGMEAKARSDWQVKPEDNGILTVEAASALSMLLAEAEKESRADRACSDAYAGQIKVGLHWVEVSRQDDPFRSPYRVSAVHRREIWWDWRAKEPDLSDARYLIRRQWFDADVVSAAFPDSADIIKRAVWGLAGADMVAALDSPQMYDGYNQRASGLEASEWLDTERKRVCLYEVWYRKPAEVFIFRTPDRRWVEFDRDNDDHIGALMAGVITLRQRVLMKSRRAYYAGPFMLKDEASPYKHNHFPYVPFWGYREDNTGVPYGLIRAMRSPQDEVNARKSKMLWLLSAKRVIGDEDAVDDWGEVADEIGRPDAIIKLNPKRINRDARLVVEDGGNLANQQFQVMQDAKSEINQAAGVYQAMMGANSNASSGLAINSLVEQGTTTLGEINDNYRFARRMVGELLLSLICEDIGGDPVTVTIGQGSEKRAIVLNQPGVDEKTGVATVENEVRRMRPTVVLDDIPSSPTYRAQMLQQLTTVAQGLPPQYQTMLLPMILEATDLPQREEIAQQIKDLANGSDPQIQQLTATIEQLQQALAQAQQAQADMQNQLRDKGKQLQLQERSQEHKEEVDAARLILDALTRLHQQDTQRAQAAQADQSARQQEQNAVQDQAKNLDSALNQIIEQALGASQSTT